VAPAFSNTAKVNVVHFTEISVSTNKTARCHNPEDQHADFYHRENHVAELMWLSRTLREKENCNYLKTSFCGKYTDVLESKWPC
jgi:hypothetical protein